MVTFGIFRELFSPEGSIRDRSRREPATVMAMPEATMNKNHQVILWQNDIRLARQRSKMQSIAKTLAVKIAANKHFGSSIASVNSRHHSRSYVSTDYINQSRVPLNTLRCASN